MGGDLPFHKSEPECSVLTKYCEFNVANTTKVHFSFHPPPVIVYWWSDCLVWDVWGVGVFVWAAVLGVGDSFCFSSTLLYHRCGL